MGQILDPAIGKTMTVSYFQEANQLLRNGELEDAVAAYRQAIAQNPKFYLSHHNLGEVLWKLGRLEEAITAFKTAVELKPLAVWSYFNLGQVLEQLGKQAESQLAFQKAIELEPKLKEVCRNLEQSFSASQIVREEIAFVIPERKQQDNVPFNPELAEHYFQLGQEEFAGWQLEKAVQSYRQAVELNPQAPHIHHHLGFTLSRLGQWKEARVCYQKAAELTPNSSAVYEHLGDAWQATGYLDEAISCYRQALEIEPDLVQVQNRLSMLIQHQSELERLEFNSVIDEPSSIQVREPYRNQEVIKKCNKFIQLKEKNILILSKRLNRIFSKQSQTEISHLFKNNYTINFCADIKFIDPASVDVLILLSHQLNEEDIIHQMQNQGFSGVIISWFWDNHHHSFRDIDVAQESDICIPGHGFSTGHLISKNHILWKDTLPLCTTQWTKNEAQQFFAEYGYQPRLNNLYGGFTHYTFSQKRNEFLKQIIKEFSEHHIQLIEPEREQEYFGLMPKQKFEQWSSYKTSLCVPINQDLSQRFFDALLCGQIPIITPDIVDLDRLIPRSIQDHLPVVRLQGYDLDSLKVAYREAINRFDAEGLEGIYRRHQFVLENHLFVHRINTILEIIDEIGSQQSQFVEQEEPKPLNFVPSSPRNVPFVSQSSLLARNIPVVKNIDRLINDYKKAIEHQSNNLDYWKQLIQLQVKKNNIDLVILLGHKALQQNPDCLELYYFLGKLLLHEEEKLDEAYICFHQVISFQPNHAPSYYYISKIRSKQGRLDEGIASLKKAIQCHPNFSLAYQLLGELLLKQSQINEQIQEAIYYLQKSINLNPNSWLAHYYLGYALATQQNLKDAANCYQIVIQLNPAFEPAYHLLGNVLSDLGHADQAAMYYLKAFEINPNLTWTSLYLDQQVPVDLDSILYPLWEGYDLEGKRILVVAGHNISDTICLIRYVLFLKEKGGKVILVAPLPLVRLLSHQPFLDTVISEETPLPDHDLRIPLSSLPYLITPTKVVNTVPYLHPDPESRYQLLPVTEPGIKIGIAWSSESQPEHSCRLKYFLKLFSGFGGTVYPLQAMTVDEQEQIRSSSIRWNGQNYTGDLAEQTALIQQLDLVITVDSAIAHLAGALGKPVWNLIPTDGQWNWWLENKIPSVYPTMRLFEQKQFGDWNSVFDELRVMLSSQFPNMSSVTTPSGKTNPINLPQPLYKQYQLSREELTEKIWDFGRIDGSVIATILLLDDGRIEGISSSNEARWELEGTSLVFYNEQGKPTSCFNSFIQEQGKWIVTGLFLSTDFMIHVLKEH